MKKIISLVLLTLIISISVYALDVDSSFWAYDSLVFAENNGIMSFENGFTAESAATQADVIKGAALITAKKPGDNVSNGDYAEYALAAGIIPDASLFNSEPASREFTAIVFNTVVPSERKINDIQYIPDVSVFSDNASAVFNLYNAGIFTGVDENGFFDGSRAITLEELCVVSHRASDAACSVKFTGIDTVSIENAVIPDFEIEEKDKSVAIKTDNGFEASESLISFIDTSLGGESSAEEVEDSVKTFAGIKSVADEYNFVLPADAHLILKEAIESNWAQVKQTIDKLGYDITEYAYFVNYWYSMFYQQMYYDYSYAKFPSGSELFNRYKDEFVLVKYIFVPYDFDEENYDASALLKAKEVLQKIADGADFDAVSAEYGENPDELFTYNQVAPQFETAAFALSENGISDIVDSAYGYYILKRIPLTEERFLSDGQQITELVSKYISEKFASLLEEHIEKINIVK